MSRQITWWTRWTRSYMFNDIELSKVQTKYWHPPPSTFETVDSSGPLEGFEDVSGLSLLGPRTLEPQKFVDQVMTASCIWQFADQVVPDIIERTRPDILIVSLEICQSPFQISKVCLAPELIWVSCNHGALLEWELNVEISDAAKANYFGSAWHCENVHVWVYVNTRSVGSGFPSCCTTWSQDGHWPYIQILCFGENHNISEFKLNFMQNLVPAGVTRFHIRLLRNSQFALRNSRHSRSII